MNRKLGKSVRCRIETDHGVGQAIGRDYFSVLANDQVVETVLRGALRLKASQKISSRVKMQKFRERSSIRKGIGPHGVIVRIHADAQHRQKPKPVRENKIGSAALAAKLDDFPAVEAAQIKEISLCIVRQAFRYQVFLRGAKCLASLSHNRIILMNAFDYRGEFFRSLQFQERRLAGRIKSLVQREALF